MEQLAILMWRHIKLSTTIAILLIIVMSVLDVKVIALGGYLLAGWLLSPVVSFWLIGEHDLPITFVVRIYPKSLRVFVLYGWFFSLFIFTFVWVVMFWHVYIS